MNKEEENFSEDDLKITFEKQQHKCYRCGKELEFENHTVKFEQMKKDHWSSHYIFKDSPYNADNCVILCNECGREYILRKKYILLPNGDIVNSSGNKQKLKKVGGGMALSFFFGIFGFFYTSWRRALLYIALRAISLCCSLCCILFFPIAIVGLIVAIPVFILSCPIALFIQSSIILERHNQEINRLKESFEKSSDTDSAQFAT